jgi:hypothetical protein
MNTDFLNNPAMQTETKVPSTLDSRPDNDSTMGHP